MKQNLIIFAVAFAGALGGANVQPLLSGVGKIIFPETTPSATISASGGAVTYAAGGTNKGHTFTVTGAGTIDAAAYFAFGSLFTPLNGGHLRGDAGNFATLPNTTLAIEDTDAAAGGATAGRLFRAMNRRNTAYLTQNVTTVDGTNWLLDQTAAPGLVVQVNNQSFRIDNASAGANPRTITEWLSLTSTGLGVLNSTPGFALDATGDINASGVYRKGGTAGAGTNTLFTVCTGSTCTGATACTLQFSGGIRIGGTCP